MSLGIILITAYAVTFLGSSRNGDTAEWLPPGGEIDVLIAPGRSVDSANIGSADAGLPPGGVNWLSIAPVIGGISNSVASVIGETSRSDTWREPNCLSGLPDPGRNGDSVKGLPHGGEFDVSIAPVIGETLRSNTWRESICLSGLPDPGSNGDTVKGLPPGGEIDVLIAPVIGETGISYM